MSETFDRLLAGWWKEFRSLGCALALLLAHPGVALVAGEQPASLLMADLHSAAITRIAVAPDNRVLATVSEDKTVRIWELPAGRLLRQITPPAGPGDLGKLYAVAISPDGSILACTGYTGRKNPRQVEGQTYYDWEIYLYDLRTGTLIRTIDTPALIDHLAYSESGNFLLATSSESIGRVFQVANPWRAVQVFSTSDYTRVDDERRRYLEGSGTFGKDDRLIVIGRVGGIYLAQLFNSTLDETESREFRGVPSAVSVAPDGSAFAVSAWGPTVGIYSTSDLSRLHQPDMTGISRQSHESDGESPTIAWSADGSSLYLADRTTCGEQGCWIRRWSDAGRGPHVDIMVSSHQVTHLVALKSGGVAFATAGPAFGIVDATDRRGLYVENDAASHTTGHGGQAAGDGGWSPGQAGEEEESECLSASNTAATFGDLTYTRGQWVYIDTTGKIVLAASFRSVVGFSEGLARVVRGEKAGYIDKSGQVVIQPNFERASGDFSGGRAAVSIGDSVGYIDRAGKMVIKPQFTTFAGFSHGLAQVQWTEPPLWGYVNTAGETVIPPKYTAADEFHEGLAVVEINHKRGYIDPTGRWAIEPQFNFAERFSEGLARVRTAPCRERRCPYGFIDKSGAVVIQGVQSDLRGWFSDGRAMVRDEHYGVGFIDRSGRPVIPPQFRDGRPFAEGLAAVKTAEGRWGYIDTQGVPVVPAQYEEAMSFSEGLAAVQKKKWGYIDKSGNVVVDTILEEADGFSEGLAAACIGPEALPSFQLPEQFAISPAESTVAPKSEVGQDNAFEAPLRKPQPLDLTDGERKQLIEMHATVEQLRHGRRYVEAVPIARAALDLVQIKLAPDDPALIQPLIDLAQLYQAIANYRKAAGESHLSIEEYRQAQRLLETALTLLQRRQGSEQTDLVEVIDALSELEASTGKFDEALDWKQRVLAIRTRAHGTQHPLVVKAVNDLEALRVAKAIASASNKELIKALPLAQNNLREAQIQLGSEHPNTGRALTNLAAIYVTSRLGFRRAAIDIHEQVVELRKAALGAEHWDTVASLVGLAALYEETEQYTKAERLYEQLVSITEKALGRNDSTVMRLISRHARLLTSAGRSQQAVVLLERALAFWELELEQSELRSPIIEVRQTLEKLADHYRIMGDYTRAEPLYHRLLATKDQLIGMKTFKIAEVQRKLGSLYRLQGNFEAAEARYRQALSVLEPELQSDEDSPGWSLDRSLTERTLEELSALALARGDPDAARAFLARAAPLEEKTYRSLARQGATTQQIDTLQRNVVNRYYHQSLWLVARHFARDREATEQAFNLVLSRKAIGLDLQSRARGLRAMLSSKGQRKWDELARVRSELASLMLKGPESMSDTHYRDQLTLVFEQKAALESEVRHEATQQGPEEWPPRVTRQDVLPSLPAKGALIELVRIPDLDYARQDFDAAPDNRARYLAFVLTASGQLTLVDLGQAEDVDRLVSDIQRLMRSDRHSALLMRSLRTAYAAVWSPLTAALGDAEKVLISPDAALHLLPFAALVDAEHSFLVRRYPLAYVSTGRDLLSKPGASVQASAELVLVADPAFDDQNAGEAGPLGSTRSRVLTERFTPLPGTSEEARLIPELVTGQRRKTILLRSAATEKAVKQIQHPRILHLATHGFYVPRATFGLEAPTYDSSLVNSGLALAGANSATGVITGEEDDGLLTALEVTGLDLTGTELVVLSACDTGAGTVTAGQGVVGLGRAFTLAGARSVLMSLWPIDDGMTVELMVGFYQNLERMPPAEALRQAQVRLIHDRDITDPRRWAPFILQSAEGFLLSSRRSN